MKTHKLKLGPTWALSILLAIVLAAPGMAKDKSTGATKHKPIVLVAMDPLAKELACACVRGYAQRDYHQLAAHIGKQIGQRVVVKFSDDLTNAITELDPEIGRAHV